MDKVFDFLVVMGQVAAMSWVILLSATWLYTIFNSFYELYTSYKNKTRSVSQILLGVMVMLYAGGALVVFTHWLVNVIW